MPAAPLATKCESCGSALPVGLPRPMARLVEVQSHWSFRTTAIVTSSVSFVLGLINNAGMLHIFAVSALMVLWILAIMPGMLMVSAWMNANRNMGSFFKNILLSVGLWWLGLILCFVGSIL